jgi:hypothetical protein
MALKFNNLAWNPFSQDPSDEHIGNLTHADLLISLSEIDRTGKNSLSVFCPKSQCQAPTLPQNTPNRYDTSHLPQIGNLSLSFAQPDIIEIGDKLTAREPASQARVSLLVGEIPKDQVRT